VQVQEAKDFCVRQAVEQSLLDGAPLSDVEIKTLYFTETETESSVELDDELESDEFTEEYERRILRSGDHYSYSFSKAQ